MTNPKYRDSIELAGFLLILTALLLALLFV